MSRNQHRWTALAALACVLSVALVSTRCTEPVGPTNVTGAAGTFPGGPGQTPTGGTVQTPTDGPMYTMAMGSTSTLLGRANFAGPARRFFPFFNVSRISRDWSVFVSAAPSLDMAVQDIVFAPGATSGWHQHPGPVFILVKSGTMTFYEANDRHCTPIVRTAGQGYLDSGLGHIARNETAAPAENIVVYLAPQNATLRIDIPTAPGNCPF